MTTRRDFISTLAFAESSPESLGNIVEPTTSSISRTIASLRGFNFSTFFRADQPRTHQPDDFLFLKDFGFGIIRIPIDYRLFFRGFSPLLIERKNLERLDAMIDNAIQNELHVIVCMHRAPGYCVNPPAESTNLWALGEVYFDFLTAWKFFSERYSSIPPRNLSFNILNEPPNDISENLYFSVINGAAEVIRESESDRVVLIDGLHRGTRETTDRWPISNSIFSFRGYFPEEFTHFGAEWVHATDSLSPPTWPYEAKGKVVDRIRVEGRARALWARSIYESAPINVGEWGVYNRGDHRAALAFMHDLTSIWRQLNWGWILWNFRGPFGVVNSGRTDVAYRKVGDYLVDIEMLRILSS